MWKHRDRIRRIVRRKQSNRGVFPIIEAIEPRLLLSGVGFLQGTVFIDNSNNNVGTPNNNYPNNFNPITPGTPVPNATINLYPGTSSSGTPLATTTSGPDGSYSFTSLAAGTYTLVETPPGGYVNDGTQVGESPLNPVSAETSSSITVQVVDPSSLTVTFDSGVPGSANTTGEFARSPGGVKFSFGSSNTPEGFSIGQLPVTVTGPGGLNTVEFAAFCVNVIEGLSFSPDTFGANGQSASTALNAAGNAGRIGYLYNQYINYLEDEFGNPLSNTANAATDPFTAEQAYEAQALQVAIWKLEYDSGPSSPISTNPSDPGFQTFWSTGNVKNFSLVSGTGLKNDPNGISDLLSRATQFINDSLGQSEQATVLHAIQGSHTLNDGYQDLLAPGSLNFSDLQQTIIQSTPTINTNAGPTVVLGSGAPLTDTAMLTGGNNPTGTITFNLYAPTDTTYSSPVFSQTLTVTGNGNYGPTTGYVPTTAGTYEWVANYNSADNSINQSVNSGQGNEPEIVNKASSSVSTAIFDSTGGAATDTLGEKVYDTATVTGSPATPTGTLTYEFFSTVNGTGPHVDQTVTLNSNGAVPNSATTAALMAGSYSYIAIYSGDSNYNGSTGAVEPLTINQGSSSTATAIFDSTGGAVTGALGEQVYDTTTVTGTPFTPTGTVKYEFFTTIDGTGSHVDQTVTLNSNGTVPNSATTAALMAGSYSYIAIYSGDSNYTGSTGAVEPLTINQGSSSTATAIFDSTGAAVTGALGEKVYDTTTVTGTPFTPTGTVKYEFFTTIDGTGSHVDQTVTLNANGTVPNSATTAALMAGSYSYIAIYSGDSNYNGSTGAVEPLTINQGSSSTATAIFDSTGAAVTGALGEQVYDTTTVTGTPFTPTGTVKYEFFTTIDGTGSHVDQTVTLNANGTVPNSATTAALMAGSYSYVAVYSGDSNYNGSTGAVEPLTINQGSSSTATAIFDSTGGAVTGALGEQVYDTTTVTGTPFTPTGTVKYEFFTTIDGTGSHVEQTVTLNANGTVPNSATTAAALMAGSYSYIAIYSGDSNYTGSTGAVEPLTINQGSSSTATAIFDSTGAAVTGALGEKVYDTTTVTGTPFTPTGTVTYEFFTTINGTGSHVDQTVTLNANGTVPNSATTAALMAGSYSYIGVYSGDSNYTGSTGAVEPLTINQGSSSTATAIFDSTGAAVTGALGEKVYDTTTVTGTPFTPSGTVKYEFFTTINGTGSHVDQTVTLNSNGTVPNSATTAALMAGSYSYIAIYSGDSNYTGSTGAVEPLTINQGSSSTATAIFDSTGAAVTGALGEKVYDTTTVTGKPFTPTGTVTYEFFTTINGTGSHVDQTVTLNSNGTVPNSATTAALMAGSYSYIAIYSGDSNYTGSTGAVEPLTINQGSSSTATAIFDSTGGAVTGALGEQVYDTTTVTGTPFTPSGTVTYEFFTSLDGTGSHVDQTVTLNSNGTVPNSATTAALMAGSYSYIAIYSGDSNYTGSTGAVEPLTINQGSSSTATAIFDSTGAAVTGALGEKVYDTTTVTGKPFTPTGTVTYEFFTTINGTGSHVDQTVTLNSNGTVPNSATTAALMAGSYSYIDIYSGDSNYTGSTGAVEPLTINQGSSSTATAIFDSTGAAVTGALGEKVYDTTTVTGKPFTPTGTVTYEFFTTINGTGSHVDQTVTLNSNGTVPNSATTAALMAGSYSYIAIYSGDSNYTGSTGAVEPLTINQGSSSTATAIFDSTGAAVTGALGEKLYDTTTVTGKPFTPTGTVTYEFFTTINGTGSHVDQTVTLNSNGTVPNSATTAALMAGSYSYIDIYSGDSNYTGSTGAVEPLTIGKATPTLTSSAGGTIALSGISISGTKYNDLTGNGFSSDDTGLGGVTINLFQGSTPGGTPFATTVTATNGTYSFPGLTAGTYSVQESVPSGYLQTGGGLSGSAGNAYYIVNAVAGHSYAGDNFDDYLMPNCNCGSTNFSFVVTKPGGSPTTVTNLAGNTQQGDTVSVTLPTGSSQQYTLVVYTAPTSTWSDSNAYQQVIYSQATGSYTAGNHTLTVTIPKTFYQIDFICGPAISQLEPTQNNNAYGPDSANILYHAENRLISSDNSGTTSPSPMPTNTTPATPPNPTSSVSATSPLTDSATLSGGYNPTGTITFYLFAPGVTPNSSDSNNVYADTVTISNGAYTTAIGSNPGGYVPTMPGAYQWVAIYSGDANNNGAHDQGGAAEQETVTGKLSPKLVTTASPGITLGTTAPTISDSAVLSGGMLPDGLTSTITFTLKLGSTTVYTTSDTVTGNGTYSASYTLPTSGTTAGTYTWSAQYSGDADNTAANDQGGSAEQTVVCPASPSISTTPNPTSVTYCGTSVTLKDAAVLAGGYYESGSITFTLYLGSTKVDTETVSVNGNGTYTTPNGYMLPTTGTVTGTYQWDATYSGDSDNNTVCDNNNSWEQVVVTKSTTIGAGEFGTIGFWGNKNGQAVINSFNGCSTATNLGNWLSSNFPNLFGSSKDPVGNLAGKTNAQIAALYAGLPNNGVTNNDYIQAFAVALGIYADTSSLSGTSTQAAKFGFTVTSAGFGNAVYNIGSNGAAFGVANNTSLTIMSILQTVNSNYSPTSGTFYGGSSSLGGAANNVLNGINTTGDVNNAVSLSAPDGGVAYTPSQIRDAYGISSLSLDGTGQTIAVVDAYDDPSIFQAVDAFDTQFGLTDSGPTLAQQYGPASSFLTVMNQNGSASSLPGTDPSGPGTDNWEVETALDVEWIHAIAPGAQIILVEANSQSLADLMTGVATAASQPGVSVVSMSWGFPEGQAVFAADEANYDPVFNVPGVTFMASTGDYGTADPEYPAFSPNVVAVGGTSLNLNADNSYNSETGWGYFSNSVGTSIGSGGGISLYQPEPAYQDGVQSTGSRTTPDVSLIADPATGAWIADPYNLDADNPFEVVGGTSLSAPAFAGLVALVNEGRVASGEATLNSSSPTETQQALYSLPQSDYNSITSGSNGYNANAGYNLVTGLGTPVANLMIPDLIAYQGPSTAYAGPKVSPLQDATLEAAWSAGGDTTNVFSVFSALTMSSGGLGHGQVQTAASSFGTLFDGTQAAQGAMANHATTTTPVTAAGGTFGLTDGISIHHGPDLALGMGANSDALGMTSHLQASPTTTSVSSSPSTHEPATDWMALDSVSSPVTHVRLGGSPGTARVIINGLTTSRFRTALVSESVVDELATDSVVQQAHEWDGTVAIPVLPAARITVDPVPQEDGSQPTTGFAGRLAMLGMAAGFWGAAGIAARNRRSGGLSLRKQTLKPSPKKS